MGFCFGGHAALLLATLPAVVASCDFYGAGVATGRPGGGPQPGAARSGGWKALVLLRWG
ncbi:hypothetical protein [Cyanobium sp. ATX-6F1]|uniref:hypothetical protein n=1 Tax=Cyanobium sp. ATX-6F1 TaxID=3137388 RepID=UPI0039BE8CE8